MTMALQIRGLRKRYTVGAGGCVASVEVLRGVELSVCGGEVVAIVGGAGAGKSTLLLCLAGLLTPDGGEIEWFGARERSVAARRVMYHHTRTDLLRVGRNGESHLHLVDLCAGALAGACVGPWIAARRDAADAVILAARAGEIFDEIVDRVLVLRGGVLRPVVCGAARVAEVAGHR